MTAIDHETILEEGRSLFRIKQGIANLLTAMLKLHERRKALEELSRLDDHLLRDMGLNPQDFRDAMAGRRTSILFEPIRTSNDWN
ncbi:MAG: DUF1127 domain-containing protein [Devosia sp.]